MLTQRLRQHLIDVAGHGRPITYLALAQSLDLSPPHIIQQLGLALEQLMEADAAAGHPLIAALVIGKGTGGLPRLGFFECAQRLGRFDGAEAACFHKSEFDRAVAFWGASKQL